jgi:2-polyprenyl-3-methyl-5-hydroxy-6-metoxy-1,4-benzoquinol methylase
MQCRICGNEKGNKKYTIKEMMYGFKDEFEYFQCIHCNCLQIERIPENMTKYYPSNYYSLNACSGNFKGIIGKVRQLRDYYALFNKGVIGKLIYERFPHSGLQSLSKLNLTKDLRILDVGCGSGEILYALKKFGFKNILGIDAYIEKDFNYANGLGILKKNICDIEDKFDLIMFHHSFEHMDNPFRVFQKINKLLSSDGICLIAIPVVDSWAWENYKTKWVQIDAPRHLFLHSKRSIGLLAGDSGLRIKEIVFDSAGFQFWGSEQYKRGIPLYSQNSFLVNPSKSIFNKQEIKTFPKKAEELNLAGKGDQAVFYLEKISK